MPDELVDLVGEIATNPTFVLAYKQALERHDDDMLAQLFHSAMELLVAKANEAPTTDEQAMRVALEVMALQGFAEGFGANSDQALWCDAVRHVLVDYARSLQ